MLNIFAPFCLRLIFNIDIINLVKVHFFQQNDFWFIFYIKVTKVSLLLKRKVFNFFLRTYLCIQYFFEHKEIKFDYKMNTCAFWTKRSTFHLIRNFFPIRDILLAPVVPGVAEIVMGCKHSGQEKASEVLGTINCSISLLLSVYD